ncbi:hypothetical protein L6452_35727 [Arctium lappa]|uniref:Uncharacterized protein n=1 Tax=Arctium lappa TaxID=4217 RepID=A0ACB8Y8R8_ARCLA|nr:hypothetical protein L6452_35727 [Arctium lappa]
MADIPSTKNHHKPLPSPVVNQTPVKTHQELNGSGQGSTISEYLIEMLFDWHVEDFLDSPPNFSKNPKGAFLNYRIGMPTRDGKNSYHEGVVYGEKYFMGNFERLVKIKTEVDPDNFFKNEQSILTLAGKSSDKFSSSEPSIDQNHPTNVQ